MDVALPDASFYLWAKVPDKCGGGSDKWFAREPAGSIQCGGVAR